MHLALKVAKDSLINECMQEAVSHSPLMSETRGDRLGGVSWWMESVRRESRLAPTSEVFKLRVSPCIGGGGCVGLMIKMRMKVRDRDEGVRWIRHRRA